MTRRWTAILMITLLAIGLLGCSRLGVGDQSSRDGGTIGTLPGSGAGSSPSSKSIQAAPPSSATGSAQENAATASGAKRPQMVVRDKYFQMQVKSVAATYRSVSRLAERFGGYVVSSSIGPKDRGFPAPGPQPLSSGSGTGGAEPGYSPPSQSVTPPEIIEQKETGPLAGTFVIKVPSARFEAASALARKLGDVKMEQMSTENVTEQFIDVSARIRNLKQEERRYLDFLRAARSVSDMLKVEREVGRIRGEIEQLQSQADYLKKSAALSTITVYGFESSGVVSPSGTDWGVREAVTQAVRNFVGVINVLIMLCGGLLPFLIIGLVLVLAGRWIWRRRVRAQSTAGDQQH